VAILFMDSFDMYGTAADMILKWTGANQISGGISLGTGLSGSGRCLQTSNPGGQTYIYRTLHPTTNYATVIVGFWFKTSDFANADKSIIYFSDLDAGAFQAGLHYNTSGQVLCARGAGEGTVLQTSSSSMTLNTRHHIEIKYTCHSSSGLFQAKLDGTQVLNYSGDTNATANNFFDTIQFVSSFSGVMTKSYDDLFVLDTSGSVNNDYLGQCSVAALYPDGAGASTQWTPSAGSNFQCVDDGASGQDGDTTYVAAATAGHKDLYTFGNLGASDTPLAVEVMAVTRKDDGTARTFAATLRSDATDVDSATYTQTTSYDYVELYRDTDPDGGVAWTKAAVDALQAGVKVVT
jgi:hypothetical protein